MKQWYYALNDEQKGPLTGEELKKLLTDGIITKDTMVWTDGLESWTAFRQIAELNIPSEQIAPAPSAETPSGEIVVGECFSGGLEIFKANWMNLLLIVVVLMGVSVIANLIPIVGAIAFFAVHGALWVGTWVVALQIVDGGEFKLGDIFSRFDKWWMSLLAGLIVSILIGIGSFFLIIPGLILSALLGFWAAICADEGKGSDYLESIKKSIALTKAHWLNLTLLLLVCCVIAFVGVLLLFVGIIPASALIIAILAVAYRKLAPKAA